MFEKINKIEDSFWGYESIIPPPFGSEYGL